jgi:hypothetical protein
MQNHVPSLANCIALDKALKAKGMKPMETMFWWHHPWQKTKFKENKTRWIISLFENPNGREGIPAPLVSELGERLPRYVKDKNGKNHEKKYLGENAYEEHIVAYHNIFEAPLVTLHAPTEADARCLMLTYLINEGLIS